jgi:hypothetical protein
MNIRNNIPVLKRKQIYRILKYVFRIVAGLLAFVLIAVSAMIYIIFTPERITPVVVKYANGYMNAHLECESVELTFFSTFPDFGVRLRNGSIVTPHDTLSDCPQDTLLTFNDCSISFNPLILYDENRLIINSARLDRPSIYLYVNPEGKNNWDILSRDGSAADSTMNLPEITVKSISVADAGIIYDDRLQSLFVATDSMQISAKGTPTDIDLSLKITALTTLYEDKSYTSKLPFALSTHVLCDKSYRRFDVEQSTLSIGFVDFDIAGTAQRDTADIDIAMKFQLHASSFAGLMNAIPEHVVDMSEFDFAGTLDFAGDINGVLGVDRYPAFAVSLQLKDGAVIDRKTEKPLLRSVEIDCNAAIDPTNGSPSYIDVKNVYLKNPFTYLSLSGALNDIFTDPSVDVKLKGGIDFKALGQLLFADDSITANGKITTDIEGKFSVNDVASLNFGKINISGNIDVDNVTFDWPAEGIDLFAPLAKVRFGSNVTDSIRGRSIASLLRANVDIDSLRFRWKDELSLRAGQLFASFRTSEPKDTVAIVEMSAFARLNNLQLTTSDSLRLRATKIAALARLSPYTAEPSKPEVNAFVSLDTVRGRAADFAGYIDSTVVTVKICPRAERRRRQLSADDSIRRKTFIDSMVVANRNSSAIEFRLAEGETKQILSDWDISGSFAGKNIRVITPYFPLRTRLSRSSATFTSDKLSIKHTRLQTGRSDMEMSGDIEGIRRALLYNGRLKAVVSTRIDSIDCNEIVRALAAGSAYAANTGKMRDSVSNAILNDHPDRPIDSVGVFVVPRNIDMELNASMKKVKYSRLNITQADGKIIVRNRSIRIPDMKIKSDIGNVDFSMVYKAPTTKGAYTGVDIHTERVQLKELINSIPILDSLTPMMRSFEGLVECDIIAVAEIDSMANLIMPQTTASCHISGKNMVLLDGETFALIAKKLYFKNRERNVIDSISVDLMLDDGTISVFPFVLSIDRYVAAVGGTQNLDLSFQYHISILKWPVPLIKTGLNLWGNPDRIHYSIASRKYANLLTPVKEKSLSPTVINLRQKLHDGLRKSIDDILNENPENINRRIIPDTDSDTLQSLFKLDTTAIEVPPVADTVNPQTTYSDDE